MHRRAPDQSRFGLNASRPAAHYATCGAASGNRSEVLHPSVGSTLRAVDDVCPAISPALSRSPPVRQSHRGRADSGLQPHDGTGGPALARRTANCPPSPARAVNAMARLLAARRLPRDRRVRQVGALLKRWPVVQRQDTTLWIGEWRFESTGANTAWGRTPSLSRLAGAEVG